MKLLRVGAPGEERPAVRTEEGRLLVLSSVTSVTSGIDGSAPEAERAADEVAAAVVCLASPAAGSVTGVALAVDSGMQALRLRPAVGS